MNRIETLILLAACSLIAALIGGIPPIFFNFYAHALWVRNATAFTGGILMAAGLVNLLPDAQEKLSQWKFIKDSNTVASIAVMLGLLLVIFFETIVDVAGSPTRQTLHCTAHDHNLETGETQHFSDPLVLNHIDYSNNEKDLQDPQSSLSKNSSNCQPITIGDDHTIYFSIEEGIFPTVEKPGDPFHDNPSHIVMHESSLRERPDWSHYIATFLLFLALSFHSILEGVALATYSNPKLLAIGIFSHKSLSAFSLGTSLARSYPGHKQFFIKILVFASMTPTGILIGSLLMLISFSINNKYSLLIPAIVNGLGAGTFLHVALLEVIGPEMRRCRQPGCRTKDKWLIFGMCFLGCTTMTALSILSKQFT